MPRSLSLRLPALASFGLAVAVPTTSLHTAVALTQVSTQMSTTEPTQALAPARPAFDVVSVKPADLSHCAPPPGGWIQPGGRISQPCTRVSSLIATAYGIVKPSLQLAGAPDWVNKDVFAIEATPPEDLVIAPGQELAQVRLMLQAMLADRFKMTMVREWRQMPIYKLVSEGVSTQLKPHAQPATSETSSAASPAPQIYYWGTGMMGKSATLEALTRFLTGMSDRIVVDETGLKDAYDFNIGEPMSSPGSLAVGASDGATIPPLSAAAIVHLLGLRLVPATSQIETFTITNIEKPSPN